jgi:mRNA interferase HigB
MTVITRKRLLEFGEKHADARAALGDWDQKVTAARWRSLDDTRTVYAHADEVKVGSGRTVTVFNVRGNRYRLVAALHYNTQLAYALRFMTHAEYDKDTWKDTL